MTAELPLILLPPSEGKSDGGTGAPWAPGTMRHDLDEQRARSMRALTQAMKWSTPRRAALLGVKGTSLDSATAANRDVVGSATLPAIERYTGVLYDELDAASWSARQRARAQDSIVIFSGLFGLVAPDDPIPNYKIKMGASLPRLGRLGTWWRPSITAALQPLVEGRRVWNLLPNEHDAAWTAPGDAELATVKFFDERPDGTLTTVSHWNKLLKGALVRLLLDRPGVAPADLDGWDHPLGYRLESVETDRRGVQVCSLVRRGAPDDR
ncbi:MAG: peroxide stress protein YaaA [Actinomycetota bacterium]|nr:peroxide stress protein YaaA [Actinomycetota bacterium]